MRSLIKMKNKPFWIYKCKDPAELPSTEDVLSVVAQYEIPDTDVILAIGEISGNTFLWDRSARMWKQFRDDIAELSRLANAPTRSENEFGTVSLLGNQNTTYSDDYNPDILETFVNKHPDNDYVVTFDAYEFTSKCPKTGQPDFAKVIISYIPAEKMVESKSLKLYLFSFRNHGDFHEDCINIIGKDLVKLMNPKYIEVRGIFSPRGGISIFPFYTYSIGGEYAEIEKQRKLDVLRDGSNRTVRYDFG